MLLDDFGRKISYLRISLTDRCDLRCTYCIPKGYTEFEKPENWLSFAQIERVVTQFASMGTRRFRLTGGEPLLRKNIVDLVQRLARIKGVEDLSLSTNATQLENYAADLRRAGLNRLNVSLDALQPSIFKQITGSDTLHKVIAGLMAAKRAGFKQTKINMVVMKGINENELDAMVKFCLEHQFTLRLIELMPMGISAQQHETVSLQPIIERLSHEYDLLPSLKHFGGGPARYWENPQGDFSLGYITPMSQHFCDTCNRVRLAVDGSLYMCLGDEYRYDLAPLLRADVGEQELAQAIREAIRLKPQKHEFIEKPMKIVRIMSKTGG